MRAVSLPEVDERAKGKVAGGRLQSLPNTLPQYRRVHEPHTSQKASAAPGPTASSPQPFVRITVSLSLDLDGRGYSRVDRAEGQSDAIDKTLSTM